MSTPIQLDSRSEESVYRDYSLGTSSLESNVSVGVIFEGLSVNMVSTSHPNDKEDDDLIQSDNDAWIMCLSALWNICFEQCELPTKDMLVQVNIRTHLLSEIMSPSEKKTK